MPAHVGELIGRYRPSALWNDVAWPGEAGELWPLLAHYYATVPDGVVNDRWMPWSPLFALARSSTVRRALAAAARRTARGDGGLVPPRPPHFDYRTPEYVTFPGIERTPWEYVRGMDLSFGYNANSRPEDFVSRHELLWQFTDVVANGRDLLVNVGPRGVDASIPVVRPPGRAATRVERFAGGAVAWRDEPGGLVLELGANFSGEGPVVVALRGVEAA